MGIAPEADIADAIADLNARLELTASVREMGYHNTDLDDLSEKAMGVHFNATAPRPPTRDEFKRIISETLG